LTFNIQLGFRNDQDPWSQSQRGATRAHIDSLTALLQEVDADIICLQEVPHNRHNAEIKNFIEELAISLNMNYAFGAHGYNDPYGIVPVMGEWGNAILTKFEITGIENFENEYISVWERRSILNAEMKVGAELFNIYSLHFLPSPPAPANAAAYVALDTNHKQIIMGDFNMVKVEALENDGYVDVLKSDPAHAIHGIDLIFLSGGHFGIREYSEVNNQLLSDHPAYSCILFNQ
jgi:endonuclease/exonuclease/phosphatase family metal-dependent hydrolase